MTDMAKRSSHATTARQRNDATKGSTFLDPSSNGLARSLAQRIARNHGVVAIIIAAIVSFVLLAIVMAALGLLITHVLAHGPLGAWDRHVSRWLDKQRWRTMNRMSGDATNLADTFEIAGGAAIVTAVTLFRRWGRHAFLLIAGLAIELSVFLVTNSIVKRPRPTVHHLGGTPSTFGFPSGHTAATVVLFGGIVILVSVATTRRVPRIVAWIVAVAMTLAVGLSRIYRGEHYPTDVIAGALLGIGSLVAAVFIIRVIGVDRADTPHVVKRLASNKRAGQVDMTRQ